MEVVEHNLVVSTKLEIIHQFCEFVKRFIKLQNVVKKTSQLESTIFIESCF